MERGLDFCPKWVGGGGGGDVQMQRRRRHIAQTRGSIKRHSLIVSPDRPIGPNCLSRYICEQSHLLGGGGAIRCSRPLCYTQ